ncbi:MAG: aspartyl/asparaginyl beta-hydroxylase domain-containing protein [Burkholderiales bacterium]|nr:aspartyl/asparaginyl beta-hydroxylase domain-containing protein [Burkholderiales bacterium]
MNPSALRLPLQFDAARLHADLARVPQEAWQNHFNQRIYEGDWSVVPLRAVPGSPIPIFSIANETDQEDTPLLRSCDYFRQVLAAFQCPLVSVRLLRLGAGALIKEHCDPMLSLDHAEVRIHVVVATNPDVECRIDGVSHHWAAGECWYADFSKPHSFANRGETERVHMVLDCVLDDRLRELLKA